MYLCYMGKCRLYIVAHKPVEYGIPWDRVVKPIQVGSGEKFLDLRDNVGDNISEWNPLYAEGTATYWIWKNLPDVDYIGQMQYRRRFPFNENTDFDEIFSKYEVIAAEPLRNVGTVRVQYGSSHNSEDITLLEKIIGEKYPELIDRVKEILNGAALYYSNGFIMRTADFVNYCEFLFGILDEFKARKGWDTVDKAYTDIVSEIKSNRRKGSKGVNYQCQVLAFLSERIWTIYLLSHFNNIYEVKYKLMENTGI